MKNKEYLKIYRPGETVETIIYFINTRTYKIKLNLITRHDNNGYSSIYNSNSLEIKLPSNKKGICIKEEFQTEYFYEDKHHRIDGPAIKTIDGYKCYYRNGIKHRLGGPAEIFGNYKSFIKPWRFSKFYVNGKIIIPEDADFPIIDGGFPINNIDINRSTILNAMLFDREYGAFLVMLNKFHNASNREKFKILQMLPIQPEKYKIQPEKYKKQLLPKIPTYPSRKHRHSNLKVANTKDIEAISRLRPLGR